jgi:hypothetical protein
VIKRILVITIFVLGSLHAISQNREAVERLDSLASLTDIDMTLIRSNRVDSFKHKNDYGSNSIVVKNSMKEIVKVQELSQNECSNYAFYFIKGKIYKIVVNVNCPGTAMWDSIFYYEDDKMIAQVHKGTPLYWEAFRQYAYAAFKRALTKHLSA